VDKISRLYADLRRESLASGSIPITVRHIESMVRMAEAHARMHLRDAVRSDDIDVAIRVMLESFISSQKFSVMNHLRRTFAKYITQRREQGELLAFALQDLLRERMRYLAARSGLSELPVGTRVEVELSELEARSRELAVYDLKPFFTSRAFVALGCQIDNGRRTISKVI
jgi:DNA replication licensing factor MCM2